MSAQQKAAHARTPHTIKNNGEPMAVGVMGKRGRLTSLILAARRRMHRLRRALGATARQEQTLLAQARLAVTHAICSTKANLGSYGQTMRCRATASGQSLTSATTLIDSDASRYMRRCLRLFRKAQMATCR